jgi:dTDP-glucose 4,6-dehydratase
MPRLPEEDLDSIVDTTKDCWDAARDASLLITGGTGFFGIWLLESLCHINRRLGTKLRASVLSRNPEGFLARFPHLREQKELHFIKGDVRTFTVPDSHYDYVIHGATEASAKAISEAPLEMYSTICDGTRHVLELASDSGCRRLLYLSSGAVYGEQPPEVSLVPENFPGAPNPLFAGSVYGEAKRMSENLCAIQAQTRGLAFSSARCFAFVGPHLPLSTHFAIGNFIQDALLGRDIGIKGDGTPLRSYLYASDLSIWLWTLLLKGRNSAAYNVGSESFISISDLASLVLRAGEAPGRIHIAAKAEPGKPARRYVPSTKLARTELGLKEIVPLDLAIRKTMDWHKRTN